MKFILMILLTGMGGGGMNQWRQPAATTAVFDDLAACESAAIKYKALAREARLEYSAIATVCVPAGSSPSAGEPAKGG